VAGPLVVLPLSWLHRADTAAVVREVLPQAVTRSLVLAVGVAIGTLLIGGGLALLLSFYDFPGRRVLEWAVVLPLGMPAYILTFVLLGQYDEQALRNLGIPVNDIPAAVELAFTGADRPIDVLRARVRRPDGSVDTEVSLVMSGIGFDAAMIANTNPDLKKKVGWLAYVDAGIRAIPSSKPFRITHRMDNGRSHRSRVATVMIANLGYLPGNIELIPDAEVDDGRLDVVRLQPRNFFGWLMIWRKVAWENRVLRKSALGRQLIDLTGGDKRREVVYASGHSVDVVIEGAPEEFEIDGEEFGEITAARFVVDPGALTVRVPRS
jgi:diacylglycerol kinase family enzyme